MVRTAVTTTLAVAVWLPVPVWSGSSKVGGTDLTGLGCAIRMERSGETVSLSGDIRGEYGIEGTYALEVERQDPAGRATSRQSGVFRTGADGTRKKGMVSLSLGEIGTVRAVLFVSQGTERASCSLDATDLGLRLDSNGGTK